MKDFLKVTAAELRGVDAGELNVYEKDIRKQFAELRMDVYTASAVSSGKVKKTKAYLARVMLVKHEVAKKA